MVSGVLGQLLAHVLDVGAVLAMHRAAAATTRLVVVVVVVVSRVAT